MIRQLPALLTVLVDEGQIEPVGERGRPDAGHKMKSRHRGIVQTSHPKSITGPEWNTGSRTGER
jgi:hypothetical protein